MKLPNIIDFDLSYKRVLIRADFNTLIIQGKVVSESYILPTLHTIEYALQQNASVILISHLESANVKQTDSLSLKPVAHFLSSILGISVKLIQDWTTGVVINAGEIILCENINFQPGESTNSLALAKKIAHLADIVIMDTFSIAHQMTASTVGLAQCAKQIGIGFLMQTELENSAFIAARPKKSFVSVVGGHDIKAKLTVLPALIQKSEHLLLGGKLSHAFLAAKNHKMSHIFPDMTLLGRVKELILLAQAHHCQIHLPQDVMTTTGHQNTTAAIQHKPVSEITADEQISDIGPNTIAYYINYLEQAHTILWNGPMGIFEEPEFQTGTIAMARAIEKSSSFSIVGGSATLMALEQFAVPVPLISTGGNALLFSLGEILLPVVHTLQKRLHSNENFVNDL